MNNEALALVQKLNNEYLAEYLATSVDPEHVVVPATKVPIWDNENWSKYGLKYYDLMIANVLLHRNYNIKCTLTSNMAELITRLAYEGLRRTFIFDDVQAKRFCEDIALHRIPSRTLFYQYLNYIARYEQNGISIWFYYTLLLWAFIDTKICNNVPYRSRYYTSLIHTYLLTPFNSWEGDRTCDVFSLKEKLQRLLKICHQDERYTEDHEGFEIYMIDSLRIFSVVTLAALCSRSNTWDKLKVIGGDVLTQRLLEHQKVVDDNYDNQRTKGA